MPKDSDYLPAMLAGMAEQKREIAAIANNPAAPSVNYTMVALERSGALLERTELAFSAVSGANTNDVLQATDTKSAPLLAQHRDYIYLNPKLFRRRVFPDSKDGRIDTHPHLFQPGLTIWTFFFY